MSNATMIVSKENPKKLGGKPCSNVICFTTNLTLIQPGLNHSLQVEKPVLNFLSPPFQTQIIRRKAFFSFLPSCFSFSFPFYLFPFPSSSSLSLTLFVFTLLFRLFFPWPPSMLRSHYCEFWFWKPRINIPELTAANLSSRCVYTFLYAYLDPCCTHDISAGWLCAERLMLLNYREQKPIRAIADAWSPLLLIQ
jgi:hypothetical protein